MKVFLGGTCNGSKWRDSFIEKLSIDYYNPMVDEWSAEAYEKEKREKLNSNYFLYHLTPKLEGFYSIAEVLDESFHFKSQVIFSFDKTDEDAVFSSNELKALELLGEKVIHSGGLWFQDLTQVAEFLNSEVSTTDIQTSYDFFISYARSQSSALASRLYLAVEQEGKSAWMDRYCIPKGVDFQKSIKTGILNSDAFVYIITPYSVRSEYCNKELDIAIKYGKKIIPVLQIFEPDMESFIHEEVKKINWIIIDSDRKFLSGFSEIIAAGTADALHVEQHTKWLSKAADWDNNNRNKDFLLSPTETILASTWREESQEKGRKPSLGELHHEYILESMRFVDFLKRRQKRKNRLVLFLSVVMSFAFLIALYNFNLAKKATLAAEISKSQAIEEKGKAEKAQSLAEQSKEEAIRSERIAQEEKQRATFSERLAKKEEQKAKKALQAELLALRELKIAKEQAEEAKNEAQMNEKEANTLFLQSVADLLLKKANDLDLRDSLVSKKCLGLGGNMSFLFNEENLNQNALNANLRLGGGNNFGFYSSKYPLVQGYDAQDFCVVLDDHGDLYVLSSNDQSAIKVLSNVVDLEYFPSQKILVTALKNELTIFDFSPNKKTPLRVFHDSGKAWPSLEWLEKGHQSDLGSLKSRAFGLLIEKFKIYESDLFKKALSQHPQKVTASASISGNQYVFGDEQGELFLVKNDGKVIRLNGSHKYEVSDLVFDHEKNILYSCSFDGVILAFRISENSRKDEISGIHIDQYQDWIRSISLSQDGKQLFVFGDQEKIITYPTYPDFSSNAIQTALLDFDDVLLMEFTGVDKNLLLQMLKNSNYED